MAMFPVPINGIGYCPLSADMLGNFTDLSTNGLVSRALTPVADGAIPLTLVKILAYNIVCEVPGFKRDTIGGFSVLVMFECSGPHCFAAETVSVLTEQYNFQCTSNEFGSHTPGIIGPIGTSPRRRDPVATLNTSLALECSQCVPKDVAFAANDITHCRGTYIVTT